MLKYLEQIGTLRVLLFLEKNEGSNITKMKNEIDDLSQAGLYTALKALLALELIRDEVSTYPRMRRFYLTEKGKRVAAKIKEIKEILEEGDRN